MRNHHKLFLSALVSLTVLIIACGNGTAETEDVNMTDIPASEFYDLAERIKADPEIDVPALDLQRAGLYFNEQTKHDLGKVVLEKLVNDYDNNATGKLLLANNYRETTMYNEALALYNDIAKIDSIRFLVLADRARLYILLHDFKNAISDIEESKGLQPKYFGVYLAEGLLRYAEGDADAALELLNTAEAMDPGVSAEASLYAGYILLNGNINYEAMSKFTRAIEVGKFINKGYAFINRGVAQLNLQDSSYACLDFDSGYYYMPQEALTYITNYCEGVERKQFGPK